MAFDTAFSLEKFTADIVRHVTEHSPGKRAETTRRTLVAILCLSLTACGGESIPIPVRPLSLLALRYEATIPQQFDYTCGAASIATILTYYWGQSTTETQVIDVLKQRYTLKEIARRRETGLSFDDLIFVAARLGFEAQGAHVAADELSKLKGPAIIQLVNTKFQHFVVLRQVGVGVYYVSDPIVGELVMSAPDFRREFAGYVLAIWRDGVPLPLDAKLTHPRDGLSVTNSMEKVINAGSLRPHPVF